MTSPTVKIEDKPLVRWLRGLLKRLLRAALFLFVFLGAMKITVQLLVHVVYPRLASSFQLAWLVGSIVSALIALALTLLTARWGPPLSWRWPCKRHLAWGLALVTLVYLALFLPATYLLDFPQEPLMAMLFKNWTLAQSAYVLIAGVVIGPIWMQLIYTQLLLSAFPWEGRPIVAAAGIIVTAMLLVLFTLAFRQYRYIGTFTLFFLLALIFGAARCISGGPVLPILLHAHSTIVSLIVDKLYYG